MTTADPQHVRAGAPGRALRVFRRWRRTRPFWGGLFTVLAGVEMFASTRMTLNGLSFSSGSTGLYSLLIPIILITCGLLLWFSPGQRLFYSVVAAVTVVYSLIGLNLGGFFVGLLLGMVGAALGFAWTPTSRPAPGDPAPEPATPPAPGDSATAPALVGPDDPTLVDELIPVDHEGLPRQRADAPPPGCPPAGDGGVVSAPTESPGGSRDPRYFAVALVVLGLSAGGLTVAQSPPVHASPSMPAGSSTACPTPTTKAPAPPGKAPAPSTPAGRATPAPTTSPSPGSTSDGNLITDILRGIGDLFTGGRSEPTATPSPSPTPSTKPTVTPSAKPTPTGTPSPGASGCPAPKPSRPGTVQPGQLMPRIAPEPGQPKVAQRPSRLTGSKVTMTGLRFEGIVDLPTANGTLKALKFSMRKAVTDDFKLVSDGPADRSQQYVTDRLTVQGDVAFYAARFSGKLLGIRITLTPDLPFPDGIPITSPIPVTFTDPVIDLAFVDCDTLTARPSLELSLP